MLTSTTTRTSRKRRGGKVSGLRTPSTPSCCQVEILDTPLLKRSKLSQRTRMEVHRPHLLPDLPQKQLRKPDTDFSSGLVLLKRSIEAHGEVPNRSLLRRNFRFLQTSVCDCQQETTRPLQVEHREINLTRARTQHALAQVGSYCSESG